MSLLNSGLMVLNLQSLGKASLQGHQVLAVTVEIVLSPKLGLLLIFNLGYDALNQISVHWSCPGLFLHGSPSLALAPAQFFVSTPSPTPIYRLRMHRLCSLSPRLAPQRANPGMPPSP